MLSPGGRSALWQGVGTVYEHQRVFSSIAHIEQTALSTFLNLTKSVFDLYLI